MNIIPSQSLVMDAGLRCQQRSHCRDHWGRLSGRGRLIGLAHLFGRLWSNKLVVKFCLMFDDVWWCLMMFDDVWWCLMMFDGVWWCLMMFDDWNWRTLKMWRRPGSLLRVESIFWRESAEKMLFWGYHLFLITSGMTTKDIVDLPFCMFLAPAQSRFFKSKCNIPRFLYIPEIWWINIYHPFYRASPSIVAFEEHLGKSRPTNFVEEPTLWAARGPRLFDPRVSADQVSLGTCLLLLSSAVIQSISIWIHNPQALLAAAVWASECPLHKTSASSQLRFVQVWLLWMQIAVSISLNSDQ